MFLIYTKTNGSIYIEILKEVGPSWTPLNFGLRVGHSHYHYQKVQQDLDSSESEEQKKKHSKSDRGELYTANVTSRAQMETSKCHHFLAESTYFQYYVQGFDGSSAIPGINLEESALRTAACFDTNPNPEHMF